MAVAVQHAVLEPAAGHRGKQHRVGALFQGRPHKQAQVFLVGTISGGIAGGVVGLGIVMAELDEHIIPRLQVGLHLVPKPQVYETFGTAAVLSIIDDVYLAGIQEILQHHSPATFLPCLGKVFFRHGAVSHQVDGGKGAGHKPD